MVDKHIFCISLYLLPIHGADIALGVQWLQTLGPFVSDFTIPSMQFHYNGQLVTLLGTSPTRIAPTTFHQLTRMLHTDSIVTFHAISMVALPTPNSQHHSADPLFLSLTADALTHINTLPPDLARILHFYAHIFTKLHDLPPNRPHDHHIHLLPDVKPVNTKPYRYPHFQKETITKMIAEMLNEGIIRPSTSPFSSPVLLVKKKDGSWRFCVDYSALNAITIWDRFPIPTIEELLDELNRATYFSKIDLRSGYHQIRLVPEDITKTGFRTFDGHYEFLVMSFGLKNAPSIFQAAMNAFTNLLWCSLMTFSFLALRGLTTCSMWSKFYPSYQPTSSLLSSQSVPLGCVLWNTWATLSPSKGCRLTPGNSKLLKTGQPQIL